MNAYLLLPLSSCIACSALAVAVLARDSSRRASRLGAGVAACGAWWAACEVLWNSADDPTVVLRLIAVSGLGWMFIGPAVLHLFLELSSHPLRTRRWLIPALYTPPAIFLVIDASTKWMHTAAVRTEWGWGWEVGWPFAAPFLYVTGTVAVGMISTLRHLRVHASPAERTQMTAFFGSMLGTLFIASLTDGLGPMLDYQMPRLGSASISLLVISVGYTFQRYGYSMLAPGAFSSEILSTLHEGVILVRLDGRVHSANPGMGRLLGVAPDALEGRPVRELCDYPALEAAEPIRERECSLLPPGQDPIPVSICTSVVCDKQQNAIGIVLVARDLREIASLRSRLVTSERLASIGQLAAGIAHEINNPVAYVRSNLGSLGGLLDGLSRSGNLGAELAEELADGRELIDESLDGVDRVAAIVRDVKSFSHTGGAGLERVEIAPLLESVLRVAAPRLRYGATLIREFGDIPPVRGSTQQLQQVFLNLVMNASQAVGDTGTIRLSTHAEGDRVIVAVADDGCGIPPEQLERVFDPFFTTKPVGEGTGLGLSISFQIVTSHEGDLTVESTPGEGTRFRVELPASS